MVLDPKTEKHIMRLLREVVPHHRWKGDPTPNQLLTADLGIDSLAKASFAFRIEEEFGIDVSELASHMAEIRTVADAFRVLGDLITRAPARAMESK